MALLQKRYLDFLFLHPVFFLVPYLLVYLVFGFLGVPIKWLWVSYDALNVLHFGYFLYSLPRLLKSYEAWIALLVFLILVAPGCYLEYPADPWEHYRRITQFGALNTFPEWLALINHKSYYAWEWSVLSWFPIDKRTIPLAFLSGFSQFLLLIEVYRFGKTLYLNPFWKCFLLLAFLASFGYSIFGIRFYGLATTNIAYAFYLYILGFIVEKKNPSELMSWSLFFSLLILLFNHTPEFLFSIIALTTWLLLYLIPRRKTYVFSFFGLALVFIALGILTSSHGEAWNRVGLFTPKGLRLNLVNVGWLPLAVPFLLVFLKNVLLPLFILLNLLPALLLSNPMAVQFANQFVTLPIDLFRVYWIFPASFVVTLFLAEIEPHLPTKARLPYRFLITFLLVVIGFMPNTLHRGKLWFQFHIPGPARSLAGTELTAKWFKENRVIDSTRYFLSDDSTNFALMAHLGLMYQHHRFDSPAFSEKLTTRERILEYLKNENPAFALLPIVPLLPTASSSPVVNWLGWEHQKGDLKSLNPPEFLDSAHSVLDSLHWSRIFVPPWYILREPPKPPKTNS